MSTLPAIPQTAQLAELDDSFTLRLTRKPEALVAEAQLCANALMAAVRANNWAQTYGKKEHLYFEAWAFLATMYRVTPRVRETRVIQIGDATGFEAFAEAFHVPSGIVISTADSMCLDDEDNWDVRPKYEYPNGKRTKVGDAPVPLFQLRSMAQTRAMAKALRGPFSWIVAMAGYAPRAAEDMSGEAQAEGNSQTAKQPQRQQNGNSGPRVISEPQAKRIWALGHTAGRSTNDVAAIIKKHGFEAATDVTSDKYEALCAEVQQKESAA